MCLFCRIIAKDLPAHVVYEDDDIMAILDISQTTKGHTLVMPKKHYDQFLSVPDHLAAKLTTATKTLTQKLMERLAAGGCNIVTNINEIAGQSVFHCHVHIIPRYSPDDQVFMKPAFIQADNEQLQDTLKQILDNCQSRTR